MPLFCCSNALQVLAFSYLSLSFYQTMETENPLKRRQKRFLIAGYTRTATLAKPPAVITALISHFYDKHHYIIISGEQLQGFDGAAKNKWPIKSVQIKYNNRISFRCTLYPNNDTLIGMRFAVLYDGNRTSNISYYRRYFAVVKLEEKDKSVRGFGDGFISLTNVGSLQQLQKLEKLTFSFYIQANWMKDLGVKSRCDHHLSIDEH